MTASVAIESLSFTVEIEQDGFIVGSVEVPGDCDTDLVVYMLHKAADGLHIERL